MTLLHSHDLESRESASSRPRLSSLAMLLLICVLLFSFVGLSPFPGSSQATKDELAQATIEAVSGNLINQIVWSLFFCVSCVVLYFNPQRTRALLAGSIPLLIFLALCIASIAWSPEPGIAARRVTRLLFNVVVFAGITVGLTSSRGFHLAAIAATGVTMLVNLIGVFLVPDLATNSFGQFIGMSGHKNSAGTVALISFFVWLSASRWFDGLWQRLGLLLGAALWFVFLVGTGAKTSITIAIIAPIVMIIYRNCVLHPKSGIFVGFASLFLSGIGVYLFLLFGISFEDVMSVLVFDNTTLTGRTEIWQFMIAEIEKRPLLGVGFGSFWGIGSESPALSSRLDGFITMIYQGHNGYLDILVTLGAVGLLLSMFVLVYAFVLGTEALSKTHANKSDMGAIELGFLTIFALLIGNITDSSFFRAGHPLWMFFLIAFFQLSLRSSNAATARNKAEAANLT